MFQGFMRSAAELGDRHAREGHFPMEMNSIANNPQLPSSMGVEPNDELMQALHSRQLGSSSSSRVFGGFIQGANEIPGDMVVRRFINSTIMVSSF